MANLSKPTKHCVGNFGPSKTQPEHKQECDPNYIIKRMKFTGVLPVGRDVRFGFEDVNMTKNDMQVAMKNISESNRSQFKDLKEKLKLDISFEEFIKLPDPVKYLEDFVKQNLEKTSVSASGSMPQVDPVKTVEPAPKVV